MNILAADIGGTSIKIALVDEQGNITRTQEVPSEGKRGGPQVMKNLKAALDTYEGYEAIGISSAGQVDSEKGMIRYANENIPGYTGMKIREILEERYHVPVKVENDVNAAALGEARFGAGKNYRDFLCVTLGTGVGGGIFIGHELYKGADGIAGELGHLTLYPRGNRCGCGRLGCYEQYASTKALVQVAQGVDPSISSGRDLFRRIENGNPRLKEVLESWLVDVALGLSSLIHIFNPEALILGGGVLDRPGLLEDIEKKVRENLMASFQGVVLQKAALGNHAGLMGAASLHLPSEGAEA
ncbi:ROK family protein [Proteiniclasticum sp. BAD-10]|uniref:ROK family protein n=1 Tax=Proteiniclasticum sediminis TaxID=2804028 RepID=A0A941HP25_9CLOT|nr:ROK family protein [Proteiniclasticum sediminis]MBR0575051.1 ROK family protein [Proteiniclasticum sediminis]